MQTNANSPFILCASRFAITQNSISQYSTLLQQTTTQTGTDNHLVQIKIRALLLDLVYQTTTIEYLLKHNVTNLHDWHWLQQLKFYLGGGGGSSAGSQQEPNDQTTVRVKMVYATFEYSYEFLGNFNKLVYTSLAHNCYLTLTQVSPYTCDYIQCLRVKQTLVATR